MYLIKKDAKGKVRCAKVWYEYNRPDYTIYRQTFLFGGKVTDQPDIIISEGKAGRSALQQVELETNSKINGYLNRGYKDYSKLSKIPFEKITEKELSELLGSDVTDQQGALKPMLAKDYNKCSTSALEKEWLASRKIDGVRCTIRYIKKEDKIRTSSRGGKDYDASTQHILNQPELILFFRENPDIILDGELYIPGHSLQYISGVARTEKEDPRTSKLEYLVYDCLDTDDPKRPFELRESDLESFHKDYFGGKPFEERNYIRFLEHRKVTGYLFAKKWHDIYVEEGYEGIILRDPDKEYGVNKRDNRMIKMKEYQEDEFKILGWEPGLRGTEDMVFILDCAGKPFKAKPMGDRELKEEYVEIIDTLIGKMATVKFFNYTDDNIPAQPTLKVIRDYE